MKSLSLSALLLSGCLAASGSFAQGGKAPATTPAAKAEDAKGKKSPAKTDTKKTDTKTADVKSSGGPTIELKTSLGTIKLALDEKAAPETTKNFVAYVNDKFYDGTIFHRVIDGFMVQGGGMTVNGGKMAEKPAKAPIKNEGKNGLKNDRGTIAMARTGDPNSATAQFFINHKNNDSLNYPQPDGHGYAVFGKVTDGMDVVDKIAKVKTGVRDGMSDVPTEDVKIISATIVKPAG